MPGAAAAIHCFWVWFPKCQQMEKLRSSRILSQCPGKRSRVFSPPDAGPRSIPHPAGLASVTCLRALLHRLFLLCFSLHTSTQNSKVFQKSQEVSTATKDSMAQCRQFPKIKLRTRSVLPNLPHKTQYPCFCSQQGISEEYVYQTGREKES